MGISESPSLKEMTAQGKRWWGDPSSPDYFEDGMEPFENFYKSQSRIYS